MTNPSRILRVLTVSVVFILTAVGCDLGPVPIPTKVVMEGKLLDKSLSLTEAEQLFIKGVELNNQGLHRQAIKQYDKSIQLDPDFAMAYNNRAISYRNIRERTKQREDSAKACSLDSKYCNGVKTLN